MRISGFATLFVGLAVAYVGTSAVVPDGSVKILAMSVMYLLVPVTASIAVVHAASVVRESNRTAMRVLAASMILTTLGETYWAFYQVVIDPRGPAVSIADAAFLISSVLMLAFAGILLRARLTPLPMVGRLKATVDTLMLTVVAMAGMSVLFRTAVLPDRSLDALTPQAGIYVVYALLDAMVLVWVLAVVLTPGRQRWKDWEIAVAAGVAMLAVGNLVFNHMLAGGGYVVGDVVSAVVDLTWLSGYFLIAVGARALLVSGEPVDEVVNGVFRWQWREFLPLACSMGLVPVFMWLGHRWPDDVGAYWTFSAASAALVTLIVVRWAIMISDNRALASRSVTDELTGNFNHRYFHQRVSAELERALRTGEDLSVALIDLDDFRLVNESHGHLYGDRNLRIIGATFAEAVRASDSVCRIGGDEFAFILPATSSEEAFRVCLRAVELLAQKQVDETMPITVSVGIASAPLHAGEKADLLRLADTALYAAKDAGRNRVIVFDPQMGDDGAAGERVRRIESQSLLRTVSALAAAVDARDSYTHSHSRAVAGDAVRLGEKFGLGREHCELLRIAGLLHDVGKIGIPDTILQKRETLTEAEGEIIRGHAELSTRILAAAVPDRIVPWVGAHHERWDGSGYPNGLAGERIPLEARILAVCDAYDAMVSERPYRRAMAPAEALAELEKCAGAQFDPRVVRAFVEMRAVLPLPG